MKSVCGLDVHKGTIKSVIRPIPRHANAHYCMHVDQKRKNYCRCIAMMSVAERVGSGVVCMECLAVRSRARVHAAPCPHTCRAVCTSMPRCVKMRLIQPRNV